MRLQRDLPCKIPQLGGTCVKAIPIWRSVTADTNSYLQLLKLIMKHQEMAWWGSDYKFNNSISFLTYLSGLWTLWHTSINIKFSFLYEMQQLG